jgi:hypothetical protein
MSEPSPDSPKIIVDDDWKAQVEKEKQAAGAAKAAEATGETAAADAPASQPQDRSSAANGGGTEAPPPATFEMLVTMLFTQAMAALGQLPGPDGQMGAVNKPFAKYFIDTVELLGEKTKGNLSDDESKMISEALHAMRMAFVSVKAK